MGGQRQEEFLIALLLALAGGIAAGETFSPNWLGAALAATTIIAFIAARRRYPWTWLAFCLAFFLLGSWRFGYADKLSPCDISRYARETVTVTGTITEEARLTEGEDGKKRVRYAVEVKSLQINGENKPVEGGMYVFSPLSSNDSPGDIGDEISAKGKIFHPQRYGDPGQIDTVRELKSRGITAQMATGKTGAEIIPVKQPSLQFELKRKLTAVRAHYRQAMTDAMPRESAAALFAMLFGGYAGLSSDLVETFTATGMVHILSVSGSHISLLAAFVAWLAGLWCRRQYFQILPVVGAIIFYAALAGAEAPVIRAGLLGTLSWLALSVGRPKDSRRLLIIVGLIMLTLSPLLLFQISFQLSFMSTVGLLFLASPLKEKLEKFLGLPSFVAGSLGLTLGITLFTLPLLAWYFQQVSLAALAANLFILPLVEFLLVLGLIGGLAAWVAFPLGHFIFCGDAALWEIIYKMARTVANLPGSMIYAPTFGLGGVIAYYFILAAVATKEEIRVFLTGIFRRCPIYPIFLVTLLFLAVGVKFWHPPLEVTVHFIDVGQGDAALVITPHGQGIMFDTGGVRDGKFDLGAKVDVPYLRHCGITELTAIFLSHAHADHAAGAGSILRQMPVERVFTAAEGRETYAKSLSLDTADSLLNKFSVAAEGQAVTVDGVTVETVYAPAVVNPTAGNEASNVYRLTYGNFSVLFTGDIESAAESDMAARNLIAPCTVLKLPHHGSRTSASPEFLRRLQPRFTVIGVGRENSFGHPHAEVLERLRQTDTKIYRTDEDGAIVFSSDGQNVVVETYY